MTDQYVRSAAFRRNRFGMFVHWGLYAIPARGEWVRSMEQIPPQDYEYLQHEFDPVHYDPKQWARMARQAGMRYAVLTAKHHDGFCLFGTKTTDFNAVTACGRDLVREFVDAFRAEGLGVGLYYSLLDWHHPDYPHYGDRHHPLRNDPSQTNEHRCFDRYLDYMHEQVREICSNYGKLDILWFDFSYDDLRGEAWRGSRLMEMVRTLQPDVIVDNRLEASGQGFGSLVTEHPTACSGDFVSPEQIIPPEGIRDCRGNPVPWEACVTMNNNWGYCAADHHFKPAGMLVRKLVECVSKGGNLILNVGPDATGEFPRESVEILEQIGVWMHRNSKSIYGCGRSELPKPEYGRITQNGRFLYYHVTENQISFLCLPGITREQVRKIRLLRDGSELRIVDNWITGNYPGRVFVSLGNSPLLPDPVDTVIEVELKE